MKYTSLEEMQWNEMDLKFEEDKFFKERQKAFNKSLGGFIPNRSEMSQRALDNLDISSVNRNPLE